MQMLSSSFASSLEDSTHGYSILLKNTPTSLFVTGDELDGNGDCVHKAVDSVEPDYTGKVDQGTKEGPAPPESYNSTTYPRTRDQNIKSNSR